MTPERWQAVCRAFDEATELEATRRPEYLEQLRQRDGELAAEVEALLQRQEMTPRLDDKTALVRRCLNGHPIPDGASLCPLCGTFVEGGIAPPTAASLPLVPGYELLQELGRGGMGVVYKARHVRLNRVVALKMILAGHFATADARQRFQREAEAVARLQHANVVQLYELGETEGKPFFSLEFVAGASLAQRLRGTPLPPNRAAQLVLTLAKAVHLAHEQGIVHRDLKPGNILIAGVESLPAEQWMPKIADFGLAKHLNQATQHTEAGAILGTPSYMAPEQAQGAPDRIGPATDVYALGAILYELLTGRPPFVAPTAYETIAQVLHAEPLPVRRLQTKVPRDLETICLKCLHKEPAKRYASANELADDLERFLGGRPIQARPTGLVERGVKWAKRRPAAAALWIGGMLALCGALIGYLIYEQRLQSTRAKAQAAELVRSLTTAETSSVPAIIAQLEPLRAWADPLLREILAGAPDGKTRLHASLAMLPVDPDQLDYLRGQLLHAAPDVTPVLCACLGDHSPRLAPALWNKMQDPRADAEERLRIACALTFFAPHDTRWSDIAPFVVDRLLSAVQRNPSHYPPLVKTFHPLRARLLPALTTVFKQSERSETDRSFAASFLVDYAADQPLVLADLLMDADAKQFAILYPAASGGSLPERQAIVAALSAEIDKQVVVAGKMVFEADGTIAEADAKVTTIAGRSMPAKVYEVPLEAAKTYHVAMTSKDLDCYLVLQDETGAEVARDDDSGGDLDASLVYTPAKENTFKIFSASYKGTGSFHLTIVEVLGEDIKERPPLRQANAAVALLKMNRPAKVWPLLKHSPDPRVRSHLIHRFGPLGVDARVLVKRLDEEPDVTIRRALILSLGEYGEGEFPWEERKAATAKLQDIYQTAADPGLHAAAEWLLRTWKQGPWLQQVNEEWAADKEQQKKRLSAIEQSLAKEKEKTPPQWFVNAQGQTMVVIPGPVEFIMGSPTTETGRKNDELLHRRRIGRTFTLAAKPVTLEQYRVFSKGYVVEEELMRAPDLPVVGIDWYMAAKYCNWLSKQEGIPEAQWCYVSDAEGKVIKLKADCLSLTGYRLPTEAEMEYATRAGALTSRYFGETKELLGKYAWYLNNSRDMTWPVGTRKPNDLGFFDMQGNVWSWCQERVKPYPAARKAFEDTEDKEDVLSIISNAKDRRIRCGSYLGQDMLQRSAMRHNGVPTPKPMSTVFVWRELSGLDAFPPSAQEKV